MAKTRETIQSEALTALEFSGYKGTIVLGTGTGKSKVAIDCIKRGGFKNILITSPRDNLKANWLKELYKWNIHPHAFGRGLFYYGIDDTIMIKVTIENIQTCYKWDEDELSSFDLIIFDEIHTMLTPEYSSPLKTAKNLDIARIGLTATPDNYKSDKQYMYNEYCPICYTYLDGAKDKIINDRFYFIYKYDLSNAVKTTITYNKGSFEKGELDHYNYLETKLEEIILKMSKILKVDRENFKDYFYIAMQWIKTEDKELKSLGYSYLKYVRQRKDFLNTLWSSRYITNQISKFILSQNPDNKILVFSELTAQLDLIGESTIHSHMSKENNKDLLTKFDNGEVKILSSAQCLTLGLNLVNANHGIFESYTGSKTQSNQRLGRSDRLDINKKANIIIIVPNNTQKTKWYEQAFSDKIKKENSVQVNGLEEFFKAYKEHVN